ncbi:hypothetical protein D3C79_1107030 [compost metagenome]
MPCSRETDPKLACQIGEVHARLHDVAMLAYGVHDSDGFNMLPNNDWRLYIKNNFVK